MAQLAYRLFAGTLFALSLAHPPVALAQAQPGSPAAKPTRSGGGDSAEVSEVIVTGTLIKGIAPVGTQVVALSQDEIQKTGVASTNNLLAALPLVSTFNTVAATPTNLGNNVNRPNVRGLSIDQFAPSTTLLLMDGHNLVGASILQTTPDPTVIPPGAVERVEVVPDGGSSLYGSDAVSGIINFITRKRFDGVEFSAHKGVASDYDTADFSGTGGVKWTGGSAVLSVFSRWNSPLFAQDRDYYRQNLTPFGGSDNRVRTCNPATVNVGANTYALAAGTPVFTGLTRGTFNLCDTVLLGAIVPKEHQNAVFGAMEQEFGPAIHVEATAYYSDRLTKTPQTQISVAGAVIDRTNPFFTPINGGTETSQTVAFSYAAAAGLRFLSSSEVRTWGAAPEVTFRLSDHWDVKALLNYGHSETVLHVPSRNAAAEAAALRQAAGSGITLTPTTALNPYDVTQTSPAIIQTILNWENYATARQSLTQGRVVTNGTLFALPGGDLRLAAGGQFSREYYDALSANAPHGITAGAPHKEESRNVWAVFGELYIPIVGTENQKPWIRSLALDLSARYDHYDDVGGTSNPKIGITYQPFDGLSIRGNWGTSFNAPSLADTGGAVDSRVNVALTTAATALAPGANPTVDTLRPSLTVPGGNATLVPQEAKSWSVGFDWTPAQVPGLRLSATYWDIELRRSIGTSTFPTNELYTTPAYSKYYILYPTLAQALAAFGGTANLPVNGAVSIASLYGRGNDPYVIRDLRRNNLGNQYVDGVDAAVFYQHEMRWGSLRGSLQGTYVLDRHVEAFDGAAMVDTISKNNRRLLLSGSAGADIGHINVTLTLPYSAGYDVTGVVAQTHVKSFHPVNLFVRYAFDGPGVLEDLDLTLNVDNLLDIDPPFFNGGNGTANGSTLGRFFNLGVRKRF